MCFHVPLILELLPAHRTAPILHTPTPVTASHGLPRAPRAPTPLTAPPRRVGAEATAGVGSGAAPGHSCFPGGAEDRGKTRPGYIAAAGSGGSGTGAAAAVSKKERV
eukprot:CAMPEP_0174900400 /NCGR_PEP_ID=MMETSP0167-20121228/31069_1 /TAXON_ID=38298 /ORGANISM="Rhodella maculata, Strain CCMP736" /LENGTH=106 /DNA_ID=CAMNT_0016141755 /DNA_START=172 /DNA_END=490 /DNA_ORIENTATION=-